MPFKLSQEEAEHRVQLVKKLRDGRAALQEAIEQFNGKLPELHQPVEDAIMHYNETLLEARSFCEDISRSRQEEWNEESEQWQDSESGESAQNWIDDWENIDLTAVDLEWFDGLDGPDIEHAAELEGLEEASE